MSDLISNYIYSFLHPWETQRLLEVNAKEKKVKESESSQLHLIEEGKTLEKTKEAGVTFVQSLCISWVFVVLSGFYYLLGQNIGLSAFEGFAIENEILDTFQVYATAFGIIFFLFKPVFFPLFFWAYGKFWINIIKVFATLFEKDQNVDLAGEEIVANAFTSHTLLIIPIFGDLLHRITSLIYLFGGAKRRLGFNNLQAGLLILCPLLLFLFATFLMLLSVVMIASGL